METKKKVIIVGAGVAGIELSLELKKYPKVYKLVGFVDDNTSTKEKRPGGIPILGNTEKIASLVEKYKIEEVFIAIPSADGETIRRILESSKNLRLKFKIIPRTLEIIQGKVCLHHLRELKVTDLLGKAIVKSEQSIYLKEFKGKNILVTGAAGSIGSELCRQILQFSPKLLVALDWSENGLFELNMELSKKKANRLKCLLCSIQDLNCLRRIVGSFRPHFIFHTAAFKHVSLTQENPLEAIKNNVFGTFNIAEVANEFEVQKFVYISSDKAADPVSIMGATKLIGEQIIVNANKKGKTKFAAVRFGNVLESSGSVIPIFRKQIADGGPVTVTDSKMTRFFMSIPEAVQLVLHSTVLEKGGEIFVLEMGEQVKIDEIARFMIQIAGFIPDWDIKIKYIGRRPGEKLEEQLLGEDECLTSISNNKDNKIFRISNGKKLDHIKIKKLEEAVYSGNIKWAVSILAI